MAQKIAAFLTCVLLLVATSLSAVNAQSASGLSISPTNVQLTMSPGQSKEITITLKDGAVGAITAQPVINDFTADGTSGNPKLLTEPGASSPNSIKDFVSTLSNIPLKPNQQLDVKITIHIPQNTPAGAYYGVIRYKAVPTGPEAPAPGKVALTASVGTVVLITVPGNIRTQVQFKGIHVYHGNTDSAFFVAKPNRVGVEIKNLGNGFVQPFGNIEITNTFNKKIDTLTFNNPQQLGNVLPGSTRIFTTDVKSISKPGRYTLTASVAYGSGGNVLLVKKTIWYLPVWILLVFLAVLAFLIFLSYLGYRRYRRAGRRSHRHRR